MTTDASFGNRVGTPAHGEDPANSASTTVARTAPVGTASAPNPTGVDLEVDSEPFAKPTPAARELGRETFIPRSTCFCG